MNTKEFKPGDFVYVSHSTVKKHGVIKGVGEGIFNGCFDVLRQDGKKRNYHHTSLKLVAKAQR